MNASDAMKKIAAREADGNPMSVSELQALADLVDASAGNSTLLLWSGGVGNIDPQTNLGEFKAEALAISLSNGSSVKTMADTQVGKFLDSDDFREALQAAADREGLDFNALYSGTNENDVRINNTSFWDVACE